MTQLQAVQPQVPKVPRSITCTKTLSGTVRRKIDLKDLRALRLWQPKVTCRGYRSINNLTIEYKFLFRRHISGPAIAIRVRVNRGFQPVQRNEHTQSQWVAFHAGVFGCRSPGPPRGNIGTGEMPAILSDIFLLNRSALVGTVLRIVRDRQTAEDLTQEAYLRACKALETSRIDHIEGFLYQTARNLALDHQRRRKVRERYEEIGAGGYEIESVAFDAPSAEEAMIEQERLRLFGEALRALPERARHAWALAQLEGWTYARIAEHLGVSRNTVYNDIKLVMGHCHDVLARLDRS